MRKATKSLPEGNYDVIIYKAEQRQSYLAHHQGALVIISCSILGVDGFAHVFRAGRLQLDHFEEQMNAFPPSPGKDDVLDILKLAKERSKSSEHMKAIGDCEVSVNIPARVEVARKELRYIDRTILTVQWSPPRP